MAIAAERLSLSNLLSTPTANYSIMDDSEAINKARSLSVPSSTLSGQSLINSIFGNPSAGTTSSLTNSSSLASMFTPQISGTGVNTLNNLGVFGNNCDTTNLSPAQRANMYRNRNNNLGYGGSTLCNNGRSANGMDAVLGNINNINNMNNFRLQMPVIKESNLDSFIGSEVTNLLGPTVGGLVAIPLCLLGSIKNGVLGALNKIGSSLSSKIGLNGLFNNSFTQCVSKALTTPGSNQAITRITTGSILNQFSSANPQQSSGMLDGMLANGNTSLDGVMSGFNYSLGKQNDPNVENKLTMLNSVNDTYGNENSLSSIYTKGTIDNVMTNLSSSTSNTTYPTGDYDNIVKGLDNVDNNWNKDTSGEINYYRTVDNKRLSTLSEVKLNGNSELDITGDYKTDVDRDLSIYLVNQVA